MNELGISLILPAYNEELNLKKTVVSIIGILEELRKEYELIIVDDASTDRTRDIAEELAKNHRRIIVKNHKKNIGFGGAIKSGMNMARFDNVMYYPVDSIPTSMELQNYLALIKHSDIVVGYRRDRMGHSLYRKINSIVYQRLVNILFNLRLTDVNWVHMYKKYVFKEVQASSNEIFFCAEMLIRAQNKGFKITGVDVTFHPRIAGEAAGGKISVILKTLYEMLAFWVYIYIFKKEE